MMVLPLTSMVRVPAGFPKLFGALFDAVDVEDLGLFTEDLEHVHRFGRDMHDSARFCDTFGAVHRHFDGAAQNHRDLLCAVRVRLASRVRFHDDAREHHVVADPRLAHGAGVRRHHRIGDGLGRNGLPLGDHRRLAALPFYPVAIIHRVLRT